ncbi:MmgE/PrpD family protein [Hydrogenophaga sp.]|uniref:MmgE/PrpD family protein n=1 Tax=Hydrogenophaga sp. TaxID=1904254 RepID=UPI002717B1B2|nr:MmgE/PrpD family protein [Hydrogenophaga sp.]MDO9435182.1 MmgE/PrpD family protein [Hydrogenophaga sp.]
MERRKFVALVGGGVGSLVAAPLLLPQQVLAQQPATPAAAAPAAAASVKVAPLLAEFITRFDLKNAPPAVIERSRVAFVDSIGVMLAGSHHPPTDLVVDMIKAEGSTPTATIVGRSERASVQLAALANGVSVHSLDFDLTYGQGQAIASVIPVILALGEARRLSPSDMLAAFIVGAEVAGRMTRAAPTMSRLGGWHTTSTVGTIAAAATAARLLKTPAAAIPDIMGIAASLASGVTANFGTMTKPLHAGQAARNGILAVQLGAAGFTSNPVALEGRDGFLENFARGLERTTAPFSDLGKTYDFENPGYSIKPYPSGGLGHTAVDAALELKSLVNVANIAAIDVSITRYAARRYTAQYPQNPEAAKFSGPYLAAYTLIHGAPMLSAFTEAALKDEKVRALASKVTMATYLEHADVLDASPAKVVITLADGSKVERSKYYPSGSRQVPMTRAQIEEKFMVCATTALKPDAASKLLVILGQLGEQSSSDALWPLLKPA